MDHYGLLFPYGMDETTISLYVDETQHVANSYRMRVDKLYVLKYAI